MAYESLYRRYRPQRFSEVRGQDHVVTALHNAVRENRVGHAYLLSGPRGTGKTSTARILAKALNCTNLDDGEPCGECDSCKSIEAGTSYDLLELDAASNNGVEAMRDLIAKAALGSPGRTKVYLLDEVHMLSAGASNALLKTLEEPPGHVVFVLATTDPHKVLPTIRSRTQHFELHLLPADDVRSLVDSVIVDAGLDVDADAIEYALRTGGGSARDTLSALDQVVAAGGVLDQGDQAVATVDALAAGDTGAALRSVADAVSRGHDPRVLGETLLGHVRDVFLHRMGDPLTHATDAERTRASTWAEAFSDRACTLALETIGDALREMRTAPDARIPLEVALVRLTRADSDASLDALVARIERLERGIGSGGVAPVAADPASGEPASDAAPASAGRQSRPAGSGRPADAARAALSNRPGGSAPTPPAPASTTTRPKPPAASAPPAPPSSSPTPQPQPTSPPAPDHQAASPPPAAAAPDPEPVQASPGSPAQPSGETQSSGSQSGSIETVWSEHVLPKLSGLTKAMFSVGHFVDAPGEAGKGSARFAVPNEVHREKSLQKLGEVEAALAAQLGHPLKLELVVEGESPRPSQTTPPMSDAIGPAAQPAEPLDEASEIGPVDELDDAPADDRSAAQRVIDAFPGAEIVDG